MRLEVPRHSETSRLPLPRIDARRRAVRVRAQLDMLRRPMWMLAAVGCLSLVVWQAVLAESPQLWPREMLFTGIESEAETPFVESTMASEEVTADEDEEVFTDEPSPIPDDDVRPPVLRRPFEPSFPETDSLLLPEMPLEPDMLLTYPMDAPLGFTGRSGVLPSEGQESSHFVPMEDRWRSGFPEWDRYGKGYPPEDDYPYMQGNILDPYNQNVLKGDYPIFGQHTFLNLTATNLTILEARQVPTPTTPFESTGGAGQMEFFGNPNQFFVSQNFFLSFDLVHGDGVFKPADWRIKLTPVLNLNYLDVQELGIVNPNVNHGTTRFRTDGALEEWFFETKLADTSPYYDFVSVRAGSQPFVSDFRGFIFSDINRGVRLFGNYNANRDQYNVVFFDQTEKQTNSLLNTFDDRRQNTLIANYYRQDFVFPGYTVQASFHWNHDGPSTKFDKNDFLVRPDPVGVFQPHRVDAYYLGWAGDGHINRVNVNHAFYWVLGRDTLNPLAGKAQDIDAQMAALELSYDRDWVRFRSSIFWASGDKDINDDRATGFDTIFDNPNFAGGGFSYWQRQTIGLFGVNLVNRMSLVPDLRSSKFQGQSNFVNPGLFLLNFGVDFDVTPKLRFVNNCNFLWFDRTNVLEKYIFQEKVHREIGTDLSTGVEYRPFLNNNVIIIGGVSGLISDRGFNDLFNRNNGSQNGFFASFLQIDLTY